MLRLVPLRFFSLWEVTRIRHHFILLSLFCIPLYNLYKVYYFIESLSTLLLLIFPRRRLLCGSAYAYPAYSASRSLPAFSLIP